MGRCVLRRHIWGYSVCHCPIKRMPGLYGLNFGCKNGTKGSFYRVMCAINAAGMANSKDSDQTAPKGVISSGSALFAQTTKDS